MKTCERPSWWFVPDEETDSEMPDRFEASMNDEMASIPSCWQAFFSEAGSSVEFYAPLGGHINACAQKYRSATSAEFARFTFDELTVLLMDGTDEQTRLAKAELRERAFATKGFKAAKARAWQAYCDTPPEPDHD